MKQQSVNSSARDRFLNQSMPNEIKQFIMSNYASSYGSPLNLVVANSRTVLVGPKVSSRPSEPLKVKKVEEGSSIAKE